MFPGLRVVTCHRGGTEASGRASVLLFRSSWRQGSHLPYTSTGLLRKHRHLTIRAVPSWHVVCVHSATEVAVRALLVVRIHWGPPCSDDPGSTVR